MRSEYVKVYGKTVPAYKYAMIFRPFRKAFHGYKGCRLESSNIIFEFSKEQDCETAYHIIEMQFRNRLSHKISFACSRTDIRIFINDFIDERGEYLTTMIDLDNYFRGKDATVKLKAECNLYREGKDWRNPVLVDEEIKKMYESKH